MTRASKQRWALALGSAGLSGLASMGQAGARGGLILLCVIVLHELGHAFVMRVLAYEHVTIVFLPGVGGVTFGLKLHASPCERAATILAGPGPGIVLAIWLLAAGVTPGLGLQLVFVLLFVNVFNLLPLWPLDGGRLLEMLFLPDTLYARRVAYGTSLLGLAALGVLWREPGILISLALMSPLLFLIFRRPKSPAIPVPIAPSEPAVSLLERALLFACYALLLAAGLLAIACAFARS